MASSSVDLNAISGIMNTRPTTLMLDESQLLQQQTTEDMMKLMSSANIAMDSDAFYVVVDLLRNGVSPDAIFEFFKLAMCNSALYRKMKDKQTSRAHLRPAGSHHHLHGTKGSSRSALTKRSSEMKLSSEKQL